MAGEGNSVRYSAVPRRAWLFRSLDLAAPECDVHRVGLGIVCDVGHGFRLAFRSNVALIWHRHSGARVKRANPESRDSGSGPSDHPGMTSQLSTFSAAMNASARD